MAIPATSPSMIEAPGNPANHQATCKYFLSVPELLVIAVHLVDHLGRAADQRRTALDKVLERWKYLLLTEASLQGPGTLRTLGGSERLRPASFVRRNSRGACPDRRQRRIVAVVVQRAR